MPENWGIYALIIAVIGSNGVWAFLMYILPTRKKKVDGTMSTIDTFSHIETKVKELVKKGIESEIEKGALRIERDAAIAQAEGYYAMMEKVLVKQGALEEREKTCQKELLGVKDRLRALEAKS